MPAVAAQKAREEVAPAPYQPFQCLVCLKRFTRQENLNRHAALHAPTDNSFQCDLCPQFFARADLRRRHVKAKHADLAATSKYGAPAVAAGGGSGAAGPSRPKVVRASKSKSTGPAAAAAASSSSSQPLQQAEQQQPALPLPDDAFMDLAGPDGSWPAFDLGAGLSLPAWAVPTPGSDVGGPSQAASGSTTATSQALGIGPTSARLALDAATSAAGLEQVARARSTASPSASKCTKCSSTSPQHSAAAHDDFQPTASQTARGVSLFFRHVSPWLNFLHEPTFDPAHAPACTVLACMALGFAYGDDPDAEDGLRAGSGDRLSVRCFDAARRIVKQREDDVADSTQSLATIQASLLLQVFRSMYHDDSSDALRMHSKMVGLARSSGQMQPLPPSMPADLDSLWREFIKSESHKRTLLSLHHTDSLFYQLLSCPRLISHLEVKHDMPCDESLWQTTSSADWAHKRLCPNRAAPPIRYCDAIKRVLNPSPEAGPIPPAYFTVGVVHFLTSSLREVSGWSAMSGLVSSERFKALTGSLAAAGPTVRARALAAPPEQCVVVEATWEMAMLETLSWSSAHMGGVVEVSLDAALATAAYLAASFGFIVEPDSARDLQKHVDWFLRYLEQTAVPDREPPFVTVYAFKAFLIAWQLLRSGMPDAMTAVGVDDGDSEAALVWATRVFGRRDRFKVGRLVLQNLKSLEESSSTSS